MGAGVYAYGVRVLDRNLGGGVEPPILVCGIS
jgi:hypothetical protein